ncbi:CcmD family protein [Deferribacteraceae bacterium V6Fe1]|nr:CcmD family protein [Deferribacteraceae bacterium V6Fe1]
MKNFWYLFSAYAVIWVLIFSYILKLNSKIKELSQKVDRLTSKE